MSFAERRQFGRRTTCLHGWIQIEGRPRINCLVRNASEGGALLECQVPKIIPFRFGLVIDCKGFEATCEARHHTENWMGVRFVTVKKMEEPIERWSPVVEDAWAGKGKQTPVAKPEAEPTRAAASLVAALRTR
jgi:hypothetical protein